MPHLVRGAPARVAAARDVLPPRACARREARRSRGEGDLAEIVQGRPHAQHRLRPQQFPGSAARAAAAAGVLPPLVRPHTGGPPARADDLRPCRASGEGEGRAGGVHARTGAELNA